MRSCRRAPLEKIKSNLVGKILNTLDEMKRKEYDAYLAFYLELGEILKEGVYHDWSNKEKLADLLLYQSTKTESGKYTSLAEYVEKMPADQTEIYYLIGESREMLEQSPYLESFKSKGQEVLLLTDPIDEFVAQNLTTYKEKKLKAVDKGDLPGTVDEEKKKEFTSFLEFVAKKLPEVSEVRLSGRLEQRRKLFGGQGRQLHGSHGTAHGTHGQEQRPAATRTDSGAESKSSNGSRHSCFVRSQTRRSAPGILLPAALRSGRDCRGLEAEGSAGIRQAHQ